MEQVFVIVGHSNNDKPTILRVFNRIEKANKFLNNFNSLKTSYNKMSIESYFVE